MPLIPISIFLGVFASILQILGYIEYGRQVFSNRIRPNIASWGIWAFSAILESTSYIFLSEDWVKNLLPFSCALSAILFFLIAFKKGHFSKPSKFELYIVGLDFLILIVWFLTKSPLLANVLFVVSAIISFIPIFKNCFIKPEDENALPWLIWAIAYLVMSITVLLRWSKWEDFIYPFTFFILHVLIAYLASDFRKEKHRI